MYPDRIYVYLSLGDTSYEAATGITTLRGLIILSVRVQSSGDGCFIAELYTVLESSRYERKCPWNLCSYWEWSFLLHRYVCSAHSRDSNGALTVSFVQLALTLSLLVHSFALAVAKSVFSVNAIRKVAVTIHTNIYWVWQRILYFFDVF